MIRDYDACLFDLDGTLIDSMWLWHSIDVEYLARFGIECPDDLGEGIEGMSFTETAIYFKNRFNIKDTIDDIKNTWNEMARDIYLTRVPLKSGVKRFLEYLKNNGKKIAIGTSNSVELATDVIKTLGIDKYFDSVVTACMVNAGKPKPDIYLKAAENLGVAPDKCIVFEDIPQGIIAGNTAGMTTVAVFDDYSSELTDEKKKLADHYIENFDEFIDNYCN